MPLSQARCCVHASPLYALALLRMHVHSHARTCTSACNVLPATCLCQCPPSVCALADRWCTLPAYHTVWTVPLCMRTLPLPPLYGPGALSGRSQFRVRPYMHPHPTLAKAAHSRPHTQHTHTPSHPHPTLAEVAHSHPHIHAAHTFTHSLPRTPPSRRAFLAKTMPPCQAAPVGRVAPASLRPRAATATATAQGARAGRDQAMAMATRRAAWALAPSTWQAPTSQVRLLPLLLLLLLLLLVVVASHCYGSVLVGASVCPRACARVMPNTGAACDCVLEGACMRRACTCAQFHFRICVCAPCLCICVLG